MKPFSLLLAAGVAYGANVIVTNSPVTSPGAFTFWSLDTETGTSKKIATKTGLEGTSASGAVVCNGHYYAVYTNYGSASFGLLSVDLTAKNSSVDTLTTQSLFHVMACDPRSHSLLAVASDSGSDGASFKLKRFDPSNSNETLIGEFPTGQVKWSGYDTIFAFKEDASEIWASWPEDTCPDCPNAHKGGHLEIMDTSSGKITKSLKYTDGLFKSSATPYFVVPDAMRGVFDYGGSSSLYWADLTIDGDSIKYTKAEQADDLWSSSQPQQACNGEVLAFSKGGATFGSSSLLVIKPKDGSHVSSFDLTSLKVKDHDTSAVACDGPNSISTISASHPTLPTMWRATVKEAEVGIVHESENFVSGHEKSEENPSAKWTNYTDGSCQRLIYYASVELSGRYLLGCDAVDCCSEDEESGPLEYQIPNVHPAVLAPVKSGGKKTITMFDGSDVEADEWSWRFAIAKYTVYTTSSPTGSDAADLRRWIVAAGGNNYTNDYVNYTAIPESEAASFKSSFKVPKICENCMSCSNAHKVGKLSARNLAFLRAGRRTEH